MERTARSRIGGGRQQQLLLLLTFLIGVTLLQSEEFGVAAAAAAEWSTGPTSAGGSGSGGESGAASGSGRTQVPSSRVVSTRKGSLRGLYVAFDDKQMPPVEMFLGVPYASPPVSIITIVIVYLIIYNPQYIVGLP